MKIKSILLNDEPTNTYYEVGKGDVKKIIYHLEIWSWNNVFEVVFEGDRESVKIPYHSVLLWR